MRLPFKRKSGTKDDIEEEYPLDAFREITDNQQPKKEGTIFRIALYFGLTIVIIITAGGYIYIKSHQASFIGRTARSGPISPVGINGSDDPFSGIARAGDEKRNAGEISPSQQPVSLTEQEVLSADRRSIPTGMSQENTTPIQETSPIDPIHVLSAHTAATPAVSRSDRARAPSGNSGSANQVKTNSPIGKPEVMAPKNPEQIPAKPANILDELVLKDDNPFREKFLKRFEEAQAAKLQKEEKSKKISRNIRPARPAISIKPGMNFEEGELGMLPGIAGIKDPGNQLRVYGVIRTGNSSIVLTNRGELRVGSMIDGDIISSVNMHEIFLKSGKIIKVSGQ